MPTSIHRDRDPPQTDDMRTKMVTENVGALIRADDGKTSSYSADPLGQTHEVDPLGQTRALAHPVQNAKLETAAHGCVAAAVSTATGVITITTPPKLARTRGKDPVARKVPSREEDRTRIRSFLDHPSSLPSLATPHSDHAGVALDDPELCRLQVQRAKVKARTKAKTKASPKTRTANAQVPQVGPLMEKRTGLRATSIVTANAIMVQNASSGMVLPTAKTCARLDIVDSRQTVPTSM